MGESPQRVRVRKKASRLSPSSISTTPPQETPPKRSPQAHEVKSQINAIHAKVQNDNGATVIRHNRGIERMAQMTKAIREARSHAAA